MSLNSKIDVMKANVISTAIYLFSQQGYYETSIKEIINASNINKEIFSYYFKNKALLAENLIKLCLENQEKQLLSCAYNKYISPEQNLINLTQTLSKYIKNQKHEFLLLIVLSLTGPKKLKILLNSHLDLLINMMEIFVKKMHPNKEIHELISLGLAIFVGSSVCQQLTGALIKPEKLLNTLFKLWIT